MSLELAMKLERIGRSRILICGDYIFDEDFHGSFSKAAQEDESVQIFKIQSFEERPGGAGAVSQMAEALGADVTFVCGGESAYDRTIKRRFFVDGKLVFRADVDRQVGYEGESRRTLPIIAKALPETDCILIANYGRGTCSDAVLRAAIDGAAKRGIPCIVDPAHGDHWQRYEGATCIKCNFAEWQAMKCTNETDVPWIVTNGSAGMSLYMRSIQEYGRIEFSTRERKVIDPTGAGDMVLAALGVCKAAGLSWEDACQIANAAAGCKVERHGAVPIPRADIIADLRQSIPDDSLSA